MRHVLSIVITGFILFCTIAAYRNTSEAGFINFDDCDVYKNQAVTNGWSASGIKWAFNGSSVASTANWHPLTFLSLMMDVQLFGLNAGEMHLHNVLIHGINVVLLYFLLLSLATVLWRGSPRISFHSLQVLGLLGALLWGLHPLRVESVAWISSRKDGICILFFVTGLLFHIKAISISILNQQKKESTERNEVLFFALSGFCFVCAFMGKPTAVVYPLIAAGLEFLLTGKVTWKRNEITFYLMCVLMGVTFYIQTLAGATAEGVPFFVRLENAVAGIGQYLVKTVWPVRLSIFYPYKMPTPMERFIPGCVFCLVSMFFITRKFYPVVSGQLIVSERKKIETRLMGFCIFWFLFSIAPVSGMIQVGLASCADRYTYLSSIPLSILFVYFVGAASQRARFVSMVACVVVLVVLGMLTSRQTMVWKSTLTVFKHAAEVTDRNALAFCNTALAYIADNDPVRAFPCALKSAQYQMLETNYQSVDSKWNDRMVGNLSIIYMKLQGADVVSTNGVFVVRNGAVFDFEPLPDDKNLADKYYAFALCAYNRNLDMLAERYFLKTLELQPEREFAWQFLAFLYTRQERFEDAENAFDQALRLLPGDRGFRAKKRQMLQRKRDVVETTTGEG